MILFEEDWEKYPNAIVDINTKNKSFLRYAGLLKTMGVRNHLWPLQLFNRDLLKVNPRDPNLTLEEMTAVTLECKSNFFYFLREVMIIPGSDELETIRFEANRGNMALYWLYLNHVIPYIVMIRQSGKSFAMDTLDIWHLNIRLYFSNISLVTKDETLRSANMQRLKDIEETLPFYLKRRGAKDPANSEEMRVSQLKNVLRAHIANKSEKIALTLARGLSDQITRFDELGYLNNISISLPAALAAGVAARDRARRRGDPYGVIMATTAGKKDDRDGSYAFGLMMDCAPWSETLMDRQNEEQLHTSVQGMSRTKDKMVIASFIHSQLGKSDEWLRYQIRDSKATGEDAERDFGNVWTSGSLVSPIGPELSGVVRSSEIREPYLEIDEEFGYALRWYVPEMSIQREVRDRWCVASLDSSDAVGRDDIGFVVTDIETGGVIAAGDFNEINLFEFSKWLGNFLVRFPKTVLMPEAKSSARSIIGYLCVRLIEANQDPFKRIYNTLVQESSEKQNEFRMIQNGRGTNPEVVNKFIKYFGFATSSGSNTNTSRSLLYGRTLKAWATYSGRMAHDTRLINQALSLVVRNGRVDHQIGGHDDLCVAALLGHWFLSQGKNLGYYGIPTSRVLSKIDTGKAFVSEESRYKHFVNQRIRLEVKRLGEEMQKEPDDFIYMRLLNKVRSLSQALSSDESQAFSLTEFLEQIDQKRNQNKNYR